MRRALAAVWADDGSEGSWLIAETPDEARDLVHEALATGQPVRQPFVAFTLANPPEDAIDDTPGWNGRTLYLRADRIRAISPPVAPSNPAA